MYDYSQYYTTTSAVNEVASMDTMIAGIMAFLATYMIIIIAILVVQIVGMWKMYAKAGEAGWKCLIPIYNLVVLFKIAGISPWLVLGYFASIIPVIGGLISLGITIYAMSKLAKAFGKGTGFTLGLIFFQPIFICILGFGSAEYQGITDNNVQA